MQAKSLIVITGVSGSGKSTALNAFEDIGFFCVDNLPVELVEHFVNFLLHLPESIGGGSVEADSVKVESGTKRSFVAERNFALLVDCRTEGAFPIVSDAMNRLCAEGTDVALLFFDCQDELVVRRFQETRRPHPLLVGSTDLKTVPEALGRERRMLADFREAASLIIDTSSFSPHDLRRTIEGFLSRKNQLEVILESFGFKFGVPHDVNMIFDVRYLPNPHFVPELRELDGTNAAVRDYVFRSADTAASLERYTELLEYLIPKYQIEGKRYLTVGVGCTGGKHRSVAISEEIAKRLTETGVPASVRHRDIKR